MQVFTGVDFITNINAAIFGVIQYWHPPLCQLVKRLFNQTFGALRPRINVWPRECARERHMRTNSKVLGRRKRLLDLIDGPFLTSFRVAAHPSKASS